MRRAVAVNALLLSAALIWPIHAASQNDAARPSITSRTILATVSGTGSRPLIDLEPDDFVVEEGGEEREILSLHIADYPIVVIVDNTEAARADLPAMSRAATRFVTRVGDRPIAFGNLSDPSRMLAPFDAPRQALLDQITALSAQGSSPPMALQAAASGASLISDRGAPFSAIVILSEQPIPAAQAMDRGFLTPILDSHAAVYVIADRTSPAPGQGLDQDDVLEGLADQTGGQSTRIYSPESYPVALDRLADRLATEMMIEYIIPRNSSGGDVRVGVRIPGAVARGLGVSKD